MSKRCIYFDVLKVIAIIAVVINHSYWYLSSNGIANYTFRTFILLSVKFAVPIFLMVSGALLLNKNDNFKNIFCKRIFRVLVPLIIISVLWVLYEHYDLTNVIIYIIRGEVADKTPYWAWYIYVIIGLYMVLPFIQKMIKNFDDKDYKIFILMFLLVPSLISFGTIIFETFFHKTLYLSGYITGIWFSQYIGLFVSGYYLANKNITSKYKNFAIIALVISLILALIIEMLNYLINDSTKILLDNCLLITAVVPALSIFVIVKYYLLNGFKKIKYNKLFSELSNCVFGVYLFHVFLILIIYNFNFIKDIFDFNSVIGLFVLDISILIILTFIIWLIRKIPIIRKFL